EVLHDIGALWHAVDRDDQRRMLVALRQSAATLTEWRCEFRTRREDGQWRWLLGTATPERRPDGRMVWYGYAEDVTDRRELEQARREAAVADAANRAKTEFLSRMSHELRTPLNAVLGFSQLMEIDRAEPPAPGQLRRLKLIREAGEHLLQMIGDMLDLTRIEVGGMALLREPVPLHDLAAQALEMVRTTAEQAKVGLWLDESGAGVVVWADRTRLRQVLLNLLSNAVKYNRPGGRVGLRVGHGAPGQARVEVSDTGVGIAQAELPRIFEPFQRGGQAFSSVEGAGIGLAVTRALVHLMGGEIEAASTPGAGSTFSVQLPLAAGAEVEVPPAAGQAAAPDQGSPKP
ncbi:MAG TPA: HAMP domain-containing sensor histidine kinase, partial [Rubrivivax sp.]|nr:HAMP domain-containing sensor histidine kinase [Rubrivivax sp.]